MASSRRWKGTVSKYTQKNVILNYFQLQNTTSEAKQIARSILNNVLNDLVNDSTDIAFDFVNEIVNSSFESAQKPTAHSGSRVNKSTSEKWTEKFLADCQQYQRTTTLSFKIYQEQRDTLKVCSNVWPR